MWCEVGIQLHIYAYRYQLSKDHMLKRLSILHWIVLAPLSKSIDHKCQGLFLDSQLYSIDKYVCSYASTTVPHCHDDVNFIVNFFFPKLYWLFWVLCISYEFQNRLVNVCKETRQDFDRDSFESVDQFGEYCNLNNIKSDSCK